MRSCHLIFIHIPHRARTLLMASITSSSHRWVRSIGHSQSYYHLNPFLPLHSLSFLDTIISVPCPLSVSSNPSQSHIDLHDTLTCAFSPSKTPSYPNTHTHTHTLRTHPLYFFLFTFLLYTHTHTHTHTNIHILTYIHTYIHTFNPTQAKPLELPWDLCQTLHLSLYISDDRSWLFPFIKTFMTLDPFYASSAVEVLYPYHPIMNSNHFSEAEWSTSHLVCLVR